MSRGTGGIDCKAGIIRISGGMMDLFGILIVVVR